ncbi:hypothetical protein CW304_26310 [Bacillus sp. UFRGS-B20]|nr:hypothetical protein CW304_26310 [Bacillus sp. UFRGS-B20]
MYQAGTLSFHSFGCYALEITITFPHLHSELASSLGRRSLKQASLLHDLDTSSFANCLYKSTGCLLLQSLSW